MDNEESDWCSHLEQGPWDCHRLCRRHIDLQRNSFSFLDGYTKIVSIIDDLCYTEQMNDHERTVSEDIYGETEEEQLATLDDYATSWTGGDRDALLSDCLTTKEPRCVLEQDVRNIINMLGYTPWSSVH